MNRMMSTTIRERRTMSDSDLQKRRSKSPSYSPRKLQRGKMGRSGLQRCALIFCVIFVAYAAVASIVVRTRENKIENVNVNANANEKEEEMMKIQEFIKSRGEGEANNEEPALTYTVCNGLSNQLLGHAAHISGAIVSGREILIPDAFIVNGVQNEKSSKNASVLKNVLATKDNAVPLTQIIDTESLLQMIRKYGVKAHLEPFQDVIARNEAKPERCNWLAALRSSDNEIAQKVLHSLVPSPSFSKIIQTTISNLVNHVDKTETSKSSPSISKIVQSKLANVIGSSSNANESSSHVKVSNGICIHHRNGMDWQEHCKQWEGIQDGVWRKNCLNDRQLPLHKLVKNRIPAKLPKSWIYYIGDEEPSDQMIEQFKDEGLSLIHRKKHTLLPPEDIAAAANLDNLTISTETHRDLFAAVDYFTCAEVESFIGNAVSTFSTNQMARRHGMDSSWYNSRSIPLAYMFPVFNIPIVYTYTEESQSQTTLGQKLLKASILSTRGAFGMSTNIHILYHGTKDESFLKWLQKYNVIIHKHEPKWLESIEKMRQNGNGDPKRSHLFLHRGDYIATWQRIDIPLFIDAEYCFFLDNDTIVHTAFGMHDFELDVTASIAASTDVEEDEERPLDIGVALLNVPRLRETYDDFLEFIFSHVDNPIFKDGHVNDRGAYLEYYADTTQFLETVFNVKPYWSKMSNFKERIIVHFHDLKPHDILKAWMGYPAEAFTSAVHHLITRMTEKGKKKNVCLAMHDFSKFISKDLKNLNEYCGQVFEKDGRKKVDMCVEFFTLLAGEKNVDGSCTEKFLEPLVNKAVKRL